MMFMKSKLAVLPLVLILMASTSPSRAQSGDDIHVAAVADMSGNSTKAGQSLVQGIRLYLNEINQNGGVHGKKIVLDVFDDRNDTAKAKEAARNIIDENKAVAVIGHHFSSNSIAAGELYKKHKVPAISPFSTNVKVTQKNDWYFRNTFNDSLQGRFLANYVNKILGVEEVCIIHESLDYGHYLADIFENTAAELGMAVKYKWQFKNDDRYLNRVLRSYIERLDQENYNGMIYLSTHAGEGAKLIKMIKDRGMKNAILVPDAFASASFAEKFKNEPKERRTPGFYTNGIYVTSPLIFDNAGIKAYRFKETYNEIYGSEPGWRAAFAYDAAKLVVEAIKNVLSSGNTLAIAEQRDRIQDYLASLNTMDQAIEGVTGLNYFDRNGDTKKPISIGKFKNKSIISALTQLKPIQNINAIAHLQKEIKDNKIIMFDKQYMYKTNVVYTGLKINEINSLDLRNNQVHLDFSIWFRYTGSFDPQQIKFLNAQEEIILSPLKKVDTDQYTYQLYNANGLFRLDYQADPPPFGQHIIGVSFRHENLTHNNMILVTDLIGMGMTEGRSVLDRLIKNKVFNASSGWTLNKLFCYQDIKKVNSLGNPRYINFKDESVNFSRFNYSTFIKKDAISLRGSMPDNFGLWFTLLSLIGFLLIFLFNQKITFPFLKRIIARKRQSDEAITPANIRDSDHPRMKNLILMILSFLLLLSSENLFVYQMVGILDLKYLELLKKAYDILWWLVPAFFITRIVEYYLWLPLERKSNQIIPEVVRKMTNFVIFLLATFGIVSFVFGQTLTGLLATTGMTAMIIGLAVQMNISNIFSGIALNLERPFRVGDWVKIASYEPGKVTDISWRTTKLQDVSGHNWNVPNAYVSESNIINYSYPNNQVFLSHPIPIDLKHDPDTINQLLIEAVNDVEDAIEPTSRLDGFSEYCATYLVIYQTDDYGKKNALKKEVIRSIWSHLTQNGITPAIRREEIKLLDSQQNENEKAESGPANEEKQNHKFLNKLLK